MSEHWKPVRRFKGVYIVSDRGRVRRIGGGQGARTGHVLQPAKNNRGYMCVHLSRNGKVKHRTVHTLVAEAFLGPRPKQANGVAYTVNHKNGKTGDNRLSNLEWLTQSENSKHAIHVLKRGVARGTQLSHLTEADVRIIRRRVAAGETRTALAPKFGVSASQIGHIVLRKSWAHVA